MAYLQYRCIFLLLSTVIVVQSRDIFFPDDFDIEIDPCQNHNCPFGQVCEVIEVDTGIRCVRAPCPQATERRPICRTPQDHINPCANVRCEYYGVCVVRGGRGVCECPSVCPAVYQPVCGNDGQRYTSLCHLHQASCRRKRYIREVSCEDPDDPCSLIHCPIGKTCVVEHVVNPCLIPPCPTRAVAQCVDLCSRVRCGARQRCVVRREPTSFCRNPPCTPRHRAVCINTNSVFEP